MSRSLVTLFLMFGFMLSSLALTPCAVQAQATATATATVTATATTQATITPVPRDGKWMDRHNLINDRAKAGDVDLLLIGDSITHGWEGNGKGVWAKYYGHRKAMNAGIGGDRTQHVIWRLDNGNIAGIRPKLAVIMIGTNNSGTDKPEDIAAGVKTIVERLRSKLPDTKVLVLAIFPRGANAEDPKRLVNIATNEILKTYADGQMVYYLDIGPNFLSPEGTLVKTQMPDLLHLSPVGYAIWAESIEPKVAELLGEIKPSESKPGETKPSEKK